MKLQTCNAGPGPTPGNTIDCTKDETKCPVGTYTQTCGPDVCTGSVWTYDTTNNILNTSCKDANGNCNKTSIQKCDFIYNCDGNLQCSDC